MCMYWKELRATQEIMDVDKIIDSEHNGRDMCGEYEHCVMCNKRNKYPCASAQMKYRRKRKEEYRG